MNELTINQIKEKQKKLEKQMKTLLDDFHKETSLKVTGEIHFSMDKNENKIEHYSVLKFSNPFI